MEFVNRFVSLRVEGPYARAVERPPLGTDLRQHPGFTLHAYVWQSRHWQHRVEIIFGLYLFGLCAVHDLCNPIAHTAGRLSLHQHTTLLDLLRPEE